MTHMHATSCLVVGGGENVLVKTGRMLHKRTQVCQKKKNNEF